MDDALRLLLQRIADQLGEQIARLDAIDTNVQSARDEAREARDEAREARETAQRVERGFATLTQEFGHLTATVGLIADIQASMGRSIDALAVEVRAIHERVDRIVQGHVRARTDEVERYVGLDARLTALEQKVHAIAAEHARAR